MVIRRINEVQINTIIPEAWTSSKIYQDSNEDTEQPETNEDSRTMI
jgi:hypothetical protein